jgi:hypothetical protein
MHFGRSGFLICEAELLLPAVLALVDCCSSGLVSPSDSLRLLDVSAVSVA